MAYTYRVKGKCFVDGVLLEPGGRHDPYIRREKLDPCPRMLEMVQDAPKPKRQRRSKPKAETAPAPEWVQGEGKPVPTQDIKFEP